MKQFFDIVYIFFVLITGYKGRKVIFLKTIPVAFVDRAPSYFNRKMYCLPVWLWHLMVPNKVRHEYLEKAMQSFDKIDSLNL